jgi:L-malate glycosyltransferase
MVLQADTAMHEPARGDAIGVAARLTPTARPLRVALCIDSLAVGGTELNAVRTAERLRERGMDVVMLVLRPEGPLLERCKEAGIPVMAFPIPPLGNVRSLARGVALVRLLRRLEIDLVHTQDRYSNAFVVPWARVAGLRVLASRRWWDVHPSRALGLANRLAYRLAHGVVTNSPPVADLVCRVDGVRPEKVHVVRNFLDEAFLAMPSAGTRTELRARLGLPADSLVVGCVANLRPVKDHRTLLAALARVAPRWPDLVLCLVGEGELAPDLRQQADRLGVTDHVMFAGSRSGPVNWHAAFDISVLTSLSEGSPNTVIEAMAAGRPVVATDVGGTPDVVRHEHTGFLVPARAPEALAEALDRLLADGALRAAMGREGRAEAVRRFSAARVVPLVEALYRSHVPTAGAGQ